jgi:hypothetical protein
MFEATQRPEGFQKLWREHGAVCVFEVHAGAAACVKRLREQQTST